MAKDANYADALNQAGWLLLRARARRWVGCPFDAEDAVQEGWLRLLEAERWHGSATEPIAYLARIVRNLTIDRHRRRARELRLQAAATSLDDAADHRSPEALAADRELLRHLMSALDELPARTRQAFELHRLAGLDQAAIARRLGISPSLAHRLIKDALLHCQEAVKRAEGTRR